jgi:hypothetical protein
MSSPKSSQKQANNQPCCVVIKFKTKKQAKSLKNLKIKPLIQKKEYYNDTRYEDCYEHMNDREYYYGYDNEYDTYREEYEEYDEDEGLYGRHSDWEDYWSEIYD